MRTKICGEIGKIWPEAVHLLINHFSEKCANKGLVNLAFKVDGLPISLNHQYEVGHGSEFCQSGAAGAFQDGAGRWRKKSTQARTRLRQEVIDWRLRVTEAMGQDRWKWKPTGVTAAIILFESPYWLTQKRLVRENDVDNKIKPTLDAVQHATETPDELHWQVHSFKVLSKRQRTHIFLFDLGDVVEFFY